jgi:hypothetical protein
VPPSGALVALAIDLPSTSITPTQTQQQQQEQRMVFGIASKGELKDEIFCLTEERNFFRTKLLESVSEMTALQKELQAQKREVDRLRKELLSGKNTQQQQTRSVTTSSDSTTGDDGGGGGGAEKPKPELAEESTQSSTTARSESMPTQDGDEEDEHDVDSAKDIRQSAEKLLQWASYRSSLRPAVSGDSREDRHPIHSITLLGDCEHEQEDDEDDDDNDNDDDDEDEEGSMDGSHVDEDTDDDDHSRPNWKHFLLG